MRALDILGEMAKLRPVKDDGAAFVFPGQRPGWPLSGMVARKAQVCGNVR